MTDKLPAQLLQLFKARNPVRYLPPTDHDTKDRRTAHISPVGPFLAALKDKAEKEKATREAEAAGESVEEDDPEYERPPTESWLEKRDREKREKKERQTWLVTEGWKEQFKPREDPNIRGSAFNTLFLARIGYDTTVDHINRAFGRYGRIERVYIPVTRAKGNKKSRPVGYAFVLFEDEKGMKDAYQKAPQGFELNGREIIVDYERGRTMANWKPRRFGGGLGGRHYSRKVMLPPPGYGPPGGPGGFRGGGGFRGDFRGGRGRGGGGFGRGGGRFDRFGGGGGFRNDYNRGSNFQGSNGAPPGGAPTGPRGGGFGGGYGGDRGHQGGPNGYQRGGGGFGGGRSGDGGFGGHDDRSRNSNFTPLPPRGRFDDRGQKRGYDGDDYDDPRRKRYS